MTNLEKNIAKKTLKKLESKSLQQLSIDEILSNSYKNKIKFKTKKDLLININRYVDNLLINKTKSLENSSTKDMLFEVLMARFDIIQENRKSFIKIYESFKKTPQNFITLLPSFLESMIITAELAKFNVNGIKGTIQLKGLMIVYFVTFLLWIEDQTSSLEKTMTGLDKNLDNAEKFGKLFS